MAEYERSRMMQAPPDDVFAFVSSVDNLSAFLPTVEAAKSQPEERVRVEGESRGRPYQDDGWFHVDEGRRRLEWGSDERDYAGWLSVSGVNGGTQVVAHLSMAPFVTESGRPIDGELQTTPDPIAESLEAALDSLRNIMEGRGGKVEPGVVG